MKVKQTERYKNIRRLCHTIYNGVDLTRVQCVIVVRIHNKWKYSISGCICVHERIVTARL